MLATSIGEALRQNIPPCSILYDVRTLTSPSIETTLISQGWHFEMVNHDGSKSYTLGTPSNNFFGQRAIILTSTPGLYSFAGSKLEFTQLSTTSGGFILRENLVS